MKNTGNSRGDPKLGCCTLIGDRRENQDRCLTLASGGSTILALADGMGGHPSGDVAAQIFVEVCEREFYRLPRPVPAPSDFLEQVMHHAHRQIQRFGDQQRPPIQPRTTAVLALLQDGRAHWSYLGDSRLYLFRQGRLLSRTLDHSYVERLRQQGLIEANQLEIHPQRNYVTRCLGGSGAPQQAGGGSCDLQPGDILLLCSDGLWQSVSESFLCDVLFSERDLNLAVSLLAEEAAAAAFPTSDNVTVAACRLSSTVSASRAELARPAATDQGENALSNAVNTLEQAIRALPDTEEESD